MQIKIGALVSISHYSEKNLFKGVIVDENFDGVTLKLMDSVDFNDYSIGEPLVIGFENKKEIYLSSCSLVDIDSEENQITVRTDSFDKIPNKRVFERFPVSIDSYVSIGSSTSTHNVIIKNLSFSGMMICSKEDYPLYQQLKFDFNIGVAISLNAIVIRKNKEEHYNEYGLKLVYTDTRTPNILNKYLHLLKKEQLVFMNKYKSETVKD